MIQNEPFHLSFGCNELKKVSSIDAHLQTHLVSNHGNDLEKHWISIGHLPKHSKSSFISMINHNTNIINICDDNIYKYNPKTNAWNLHQTLSIPTPTINNVCVDSDSKTNDLYLNTLDKFIESKFYKYQYYKDTIKPTAISIEHNFIENSIVINGKYHIFALNQDENGRTLQHSVLNSKTHTFDKVDEFETGLANFSIIYIKKKQRMFLFGGLLPFSINNHCLSDIYSTSLSTNNKWMKIPDIQLPLPLADTICVATNDEQYIIILGGSSCVQTSQNMNYCDGDSISSISNDTEYKDMDSIYVFNVNTMDIKQSSIHCPKSAVFNAVIPKTLSITKQGIIKRFIKAFYEPYVANDIINIIKTFYENEYLHLFDRNGFDKMHWKISVDDILNSI